MGKTKDVLERVRGDKQLLSAHGITQEELDFVAGVDMFGSLKSVKDVLFIIGLSRRYRESDTPPSQG